MKTISAKKVRLKVKELAIKANIILRPDVKKFLQAAKKKEPQRRSQQAIELILKNARIAKTEKLAICQDTGLPVVFVELGENLRITNGSLKKAITDGVKDAYKSSGFRNSIVKDPLKRTKPGFAPGIIHFDLVAGEKIRLTVFPKGFGSENKSKTIMLNPTNGEKEIIKFAEQAVKDAGSSACPPYVIGLGVGGTLDKAVYLSKKALLDKLGARTKLEKTILKQINKLKIGAFGLGGNSTALSVRVLTHPTHIAGLPVAINISCHALRSASAVL